LKRSEHEVATLKSKLSASQSEELHLKGSLSVAVGNLDVIQKDEGAVVSLLSTAMESKPPTAAVQHFASQILAKCLVDGQVKLKTKGRAITYERAKGKRSMKVDSKPRSRNRWLKKEANNILSVCGMEDDDAIIALLKVIAKKKGLFIAERSKLSLNTAQSVVLRDHVKSSNTGLLRMKQCI